MTNFCMLQRLVSKQFFIFTVFWYPQGVGGFLPYPRVSNHPDLGGTVLILSENPESRLDLSWDAKCPDFEKQQSCREVIDQKNSLNGIFRAIMR